MAHGKFDLTNGLLARRTPAKPELFTYLVDEDEHEVDVVPIPSAPGVDEARERHEGSETDLARAIEEFWESERRRFGDPRPRPAEVVYSPPEDYFEFEDESDDSMDEIMEIDPSQDGSMQALDLPAEEQTPLDASPGSEEKVIAQNVSASQKPKARIQRGLIKEEYQQVQNNALLAAAMNNEPRLEEAFTKDLIKEVSSASSGTEYRTLAASPTPLSFVPHPSGLRLKICNSSLDINTSAAHDEDISTVP